MVARPWLNWNRRLQAVILVRVFVLVPVRAYRRTCPRHALYRAVRVVHALDVRVRLRPLLQAHLKNRPCRIAIRHGRFLRRDSLNLFIIILVIVICKVTFL